MIAAASVARDGSEPVAFALAPGEAFYERAARQLLDGAASWAGDGDLSRVRVLVPALPMAAGLRAALVKAAAPAALLLPRFETLESWAAAVPFSGIPEPLPASRRLVLLYEALRSNGGFDEAALWGIAAEIAALFDELTVAAVQLPADANELSVQLERAYALRDSSLLAFEARIVHELWRALSSAGAPDAAAVYRLRLAALVRQAAGAPSPQPLFVLLDAAPDESLDPAEREFFRSYGRSQPLWIVYPAPREARPTPLLATLDAAWPSDPVASFPLYERARQIAAHFPESPLRGRVRFVPAAGREQEAEAAVAQVAEWLTAGLRRIALVAQDRLTARRVRALLERDGVLASDETGWLLSTSRAAAVVDALIETAATGAYHRDLIDLCKSPFVFSDIDGHAREAAVFALESAIRRGQVRGGFSRVRRCVTAAEADGKATALSALDRIEAATTLLAARPAPLPRWIGRLMKALEAIGALAALRDDAAGQAVVDLLETRSRELAGSTAEFSFVAWRDWLNREFEAASFRDSGIASPIVVTPLNAVCLRCFEAALLIGGDARQLAPVSHGAFFNEAVRRELGLRTRADAERALLRDLELLFATVPRVTVTWQSVQNGEANLLAPGLSLLSTLHTLAWGEDLVCGPLPARSEPGHDAGTAPGLTQRAAPAAPRERLPARVSVSAYASLVACPYRFFARHVLGLGEIDEVSEEMEKGDYGELVHRVLERFHREHPVVLAMTERAALDALQACVAEVFAPAIADNFLAIAWRQRWEKRLAGYLAWQRERERSGWRWEQAEVNVRCALPLSEGGSVELHGRIDRIDGHADGGAAALYDYKTQTVKAIRERLKDDVQLPAYALMHGNAAQAAYVALDGECVDDVSSDEGRGDLMAAAEAQGQRLVRVFEALRGGARLPAHGVERVCAWCEMRGLCRKDYV